MKIRWFALSRCSETNRNKIRIFRLQRVCKFVTYVFGLPEQICYFLYLIFRELS
jgi:hypothetical protein